MFRSVLPERLGMSYSVPLIGIGDGIVKSPGERFRLAVTVTCRKCQRQVNGFIMFSEQNQIVDTEAFMVFADGPLCNSCSEESDASPSSI